MTTDRLRIIAAFVVLAMWVASITYNALDHSYHPPWTIHAAMMALATWLFAPYLTGRKGGKQ